ncbi:ParA family protein, partial [Aeromonas caviae]|uniref:ParA family protein n=1 Tax=Aeromonas caviae TaxID=648 RepID=UPI003FD76B50
MSAPDAAPRFMPFDEEQAMQVVSIISTKGGVGKTTTAANLGGFAADAGLRVLLLDLDVQPTLSSYFTLDLRAPA